MHVSIAGTIDQAVDRAVEYHCDCFQIFTTNPRGWKPSRLEAEEVESFKMKLRKQNIGPVVSHMPYLPNLSSPKDDFYEKSLATLVGEVDRCQTLKVPFVVVHLGSHMGFGRDAGLKRLLNSLDTGTAKVKGDLKILLENTAGQSNSMGTKFEELREIIENARHPKRLGVCLDTCHAYAGGYDLHTKKSVQVTLERFHETVGRDRLMVVHLNDSENGLGSGLDRHQNIGEGYIGREGFKALLHHDTIRELPLILETPYDKEGDDQRNIEMVRTLAK